MKTKITAILSVLLVLALLLSTGCGKKDETPEDNTTTLSDEQGLTPNRSSTQQKKTSATSTSCPIRIM